MFQPSKLRVRTGLIGLAVGLWPFVSGCTSDHFGRSESDTPYVVQRPTYAIEGTKPLYLGGYAGATYGPSVRPVR